MSYLFDANAERIKGQFSSAVAKPFTIVAWVRRSNTQWLDANNVIFADLNDDEADLNSQHLIGNLATAQRAGCRAREEADGSFHQSGPTWGDTRFDDTWVTVIGVFRSDTDRQGYVEAGNLVGTLTTNSDPTNSVQYISIGGSGYTNFDYADALVAEVAVFDKALSTAEIAALETASQAGPAPNSVASANCIGYWPLKINQSTHADQSGNGGPTLTVSGTPTWSSEHPTIAAVPTAPQQVVASVERVTIDWDAASEPVTQNLSKGQDETQCVPFFTKRLVSGSLTDDFRERTMKVEMIDNGGTPAVRVSAAGKTSADDHRIEVYVVEFAENITVQQVDADIADAASSANITITDVGDQTSAFFLYSAQFTHGSAQDFPGYACVRPIWNGVSTTSVTIERQGTTGTLDGVLYVVSCDSDEFSVQHEEISVAATDEVTNNTITAVPVATSFLLTHFRSNEFGDDPLDWAFVADLSSSTNVRVRRSIAGAANATAEVGVQVVTALGGQWSVQRGDFITTSNLTEQTVISPVDLTRAFVKTGTHEMGVNSFGTSDQTDGNIVDEIGPAVYLSASNTLRWTRESVAETGNIIPWEVIQFSAGLNNPILIPTGPLR